MHTGHASAFNGNLILPGNNACAGAQRTGLRTGSARCPTQHVKTNIHVCSMPPQQKFIDAHWRLERDTPTLSESVETPLPTPGFPGDLVNGNRVEDTSRERRRYHLDGLVWTGNVPFSPDEASAQMR